MRTEAAPDGVRVLSLAIVAGTAFAFGAVYPWAYWPAFAGCSGIAAMTLWTAPRSTVREQTVLAAALGGVALAIGAQLIPLPHDIRDLLSPAAEKVRNVSDLQYVAGLLTSAADAPAGTAAGTAPLSIDPASTMTALGCLVALALFTVGLAVHLTRRGGLERLVAGVIVIGVVLVVAAIVQQATFNGRIYGFWQPRSPGAHPFGPFVNRNHFAGWMIMAIPTGLGYVMGLVTRSARDVKARWSDRVRWLSSPAASRLVLAASAISVLAGSVVMTLSRSGIASLLIAVAAFAMAMTLARGQRMRSVGPVAYLVLVVVGALAWVGLEAVLQRFSDLGDTGLAGRVLVWRDTMAMARDFPWTGTGLNTFATAVVSYERPGRSVLFTEAHNAYLQLASEGGLLVGLPAAAAIAAFAIVVRRRFTEPHVSQMTWWIRVGALAGLLAIALQATVEFSLQIPANAVLLAVLCAIALHREAGSATRSAPRVWQRGIAVPCA